MNIVIKYSRSAFKHNITEADIRMAFDNIIDEDTLKVFHAMKCRNIYLPLIKQRE